jgi:hypothetical protein
MEEPCVSAGEGNNVNYILYVKPYYKKDLDVVEWATLLVENEISRLDTHYTKYFTRNLVKERVSACVYKCIGEKVRGDINV